MQSFSNIFGIFITIDSCSEILLFTYHCINTPVFCWYNEMSLNVLGQSTESNRVQCPSVQVIPLCLQDFGP